MRKIPRAYSQTLTTQSGSSITGTAPNESFVARSKPHEGIAVNSTHIYFTHVPLNRAIGRAALGGGSVELEWLKLASGSGDICDLAINTEHIYWCESEHIGRCTVAGGSVEEHWLTLEAEYAYAITVDATHIYYRGYDNIVKAEVATGAVVGEYSTGAENAKELSPLPPSRYCRTRDSRCGSHRL